jgi:hypothetical protein
MKDMIGTAVNAKYVIKNAMKGTIGMVVNAPYVGTAAMKGINGQDVSVKNAISMPINQYTTGNSVFMEPSMLTVSALSSAKSAAKQ